MSRVVWTPGISATRVCQLRPVGTASMTSRGITCERCACCTSTSGASPDTVMVSSRAPTSISTSIVIAKLAGSASSSRMTVEKPGRVNVTS